MIFSNPDEVACEPLPKEGNTMTASIASLASRNENLKPLKVLFHNSELGVLAGDSVYLRPESYTAPYMGHVYTLNDVKFVLVPRQMVIAKDVKNF